VRLIALFVVLTVAACASPPKQGASPNVQFIEAGGEALAPPDNTSPVAQTQWRISPLDVLEVKVFGVDDLNGEYQVDPDGRLKFPLVGGIDVKGVTVFELANALEQKLGETYLRNPDVTVRISEPFQRTLTVEGAVKKPGVFPVANEISLVQAIALAEGTTDLANPKRVIVFRTVGGQKQAAGYNLEEIRRGNADDPKLFGNDVVVVDGSQLASGYREFLRSVPLLNLFVLYELY
jgi:polysaccharide export outer membrane protein